MSFIVCSSAIPSANAAFAASSTVTTSFNPLIFAPGASAGRIQPVVFLRARSVPVTARVIKKTEAVKPIQRCSARKRWYMVLLSFNPIRAAGPFVRLSRQLHHFALDANGLRTDTVPPGRRRKRLLIQDDEIGPIPWSDLPDLVLHEHRISSAAGVAAQRFGHRQILLSHPEAAVERLARHRRFNSQKRIVRHHGPVGPEHND